MIVARRRCLPHEIPSWVSDGSVYYITICTTPRGLNQLCTPAASQLILDGVRFYHEQQRWFATLFLLMPDHLHALLSFPRDASVRQVIASWKGYFAKRCGIQWQRDFFEHRLRNERSEDEKIHYILENPVRQGLVARAEDWPHVWRLW